MGGVFLDPREKRHLELIDETLPLIGVGGIASGGDAYAKIRAGANAVCIAALVCCSRA